MNDFSLLALDGFTYTSVTQGPHSGTGYLTGPDGSRAAIQWEVSDGAYIARNAAPGEEHWGAYRLGFAKAVTSLEALRENLAELLPKLRILYQRARGVS